jgi:hypothetical protein
MDRTEKRQLYHLWKRFRSLHYWLFLVLAFVFGTVFVFAYRQNNVVSLQLAAKLTAVDKANGDVETALRNLREHIYSHMNGSLRSDNGTRQPIQLEATYNRLVAASKASTDAARSKVYSDAQALCEKEYPGSFYGGPRIPCISSYIDSHKVADPPSVPDSLYKFDFVSPTWSPDLAGWTLLAALLCFVLFIIGAISERLLRYEVHKHS